MSRGATTRRRAARATEIHLTASLLAGLLAVGGLVATAWGEAAPAGSATLRAPMASPAQARPQEAVRTAIVLFPWTQAGTLAPQVHVTARLSGVCWVGAFPDIDDKYAGRCMTGNYIRTPCFSPMTAQPAEVVCGVGSPWDSSQALLIKLTEPMPRSEANKGGDWTGWALQLGNRARCILADGTHSPPVSGGPAPSECADDAFAFALDTGSQPWTVWYGTSATFGGRASSGEVKVAVAYNGPD